MNNNYPPPIPAWREALNFLALIACFPLIFAFGLVYVLFFDKDPRSELHYYRREGP